MEENAQIPLSFRVDPRRRRSGGAGRLWPGHGCVPCGPTRPRPDREPARLDAPAPLSDDPNDPIRAVVGDRGIDRTSVVWGQRVSVSVDLGGHRLIKQKNKTKNTPSTNLNT